ncbi:hypothetical protein B0H13DRAFT_2358226 [Mycena leptocephala]|nr:hypothetical protein B0H13DRAFT_2358226 [Mycena leptocephala]
MTAPRLSRTPLFTSNYWASQPLDDGSWINLPSDALGAGHAKFLDALKELDTAGYPGFAHAADLDCIDFSLALGIALEPALVAQAGSYQSGYNAGRARAWAYLLHFQVLDFLLAGDHPRLESGPALQPDILLSLASVKVYFLVVTALNC